MKNYKSFKIININIVDPAAGTVGPGELCVLNGLFAESAEGFPVVDGQGLYAAPGLVDMHVHLRDPGQTEKEDVFSGCGAAAAGGVTSLLCMANTVPPTDSPELVQAILQKSKKAPAAVCPAACVTQGMRGETLTDFYALKKAGAAALSDDGKPIGNAGLMLEALKRAKPLDMLVIAHSEDASLTDGKAVNAGPVAELLGVPGRPAAAEEYMIARDALLAMTADAAVHIAHVSTARSVDIIRRAKAAGVKITCETAPHYFTFTENDVLRLGTSAKMFPPLRTEADRLAIIEGLIDGTIDAIATDHAPHTAAEKSLPLADAPGGVVGLETSLSASLTALYHTGLMTLPELFRRLSYTPARLLGLEAGTLSPGASADFILFDPQRELLCDPAEFYSKGRATPFAGMTLTGAVTATYKSGVRVFARP